jgi:putative nucleotidyltransferase with HDIG domain
MPRTSHRLSLFSQRLDRVAFVAYFLGAVVPLGALAWVTQRYAIPANPTLRVFFLPLLISIALLSLGSFLALRKTARDALARLNRDNRNLAILLRGSRSLSAVAHDDEVMQVSAGCAGELTRARAAYFLVPGSTEGEVTVAQSAGARADELFTRQRERIEALAVAAIVEQTPQHPEPGTLLAVPCGDDASVRGVILTALDDALDGESRASAVTLLSTLSRLASVALRNADLREAQRNFFTHTTHLLVSALDAHLDFQGDHSSRVAHLSVAIGRALGLEEARLQQLHFAALLHDIGMLGIDRRRLTERPVVQRHPRLGSEMLQRIRLWEGLAPIVLHHHEWFDGGGYPDGLRGEEIPLESRIIGLAEAFDSMTNTSSYRPTISEEEARKRIRECAGSQFDPRLVEVFERLPKDEEVPV